MNESGDYLAGDINSVPRSNTQSPVGRECGHCHRRCGTAAGGYATINGISVCSKPTVAGRPDCYREIYYRFHPLTDCPDCMAEQTTERGRTP